MDGKKQRKPNKFSFRPPGREWRDAQSAARLTVSLMPHFCLSLTMPSTLFSPSGPFPPDFGVFLLIPWGKHHFWCFHPLSQPIDNLNCAAVVVSKKSLVEFYVPLCNHRNGSPCSNHSLSAAAMLWSEGSSLELVMGAACSRVLKPWPGNQVRNRCSSVQQV